MSFNVINKIIHQNYKPVWRLIDAQNHVYIIKIQKNAFLLNIFKYLIILYRYVVD